MTKLHQTDNHANHIMEQPYAELDLRLLVRRAALELRLLIKKIRHVPLEAQTAALSSFVARSGFHREAARLYLQNLGRHREAIHRIASSGFAEGSHAPSSNVRKIDRNRTRK